MAGRTPAEAVNNFLEPLQQAVSCVTRAVINVRGGYYPSSEPHILLLVDGDAVHVGSSSRTLSIRIIQHYRVIEAEEPSGPWKVTTVAYYYQLLDDDQELFAYHWHPRSEPTWPHLHVYVSDVDRKHFPTGRIALEQFLRLIIEEFDVQALRSDWNDTLLRTQTAHEAWRTWP